MTARDHLRALVDATPPGAVLTVPREWLAEVLTPVVVEVAPPPPTELLSVEQAAARLGISPGHLYRIAKKLPFTRKISHRVLRFDPIGLETWLEHRAA